MYFEKEKNTLLKVDCNLLTGKYEICKIKAEHKKRLSYFGRRIPIPIQKCANA